jgi:hypothetical protein
MFGAGLYSVKSLARCQIAAAADLGDRSLMMSAIVRSNRQQCAIDSFITHRNTAAYSAWKAGVMGRPRALALEHRERRDPYQQRVSRLVGDAYGHRATFGVAGP